MPKYTAENNQSIGDVDLLDEKVSLKRTRMRNKNGGFQ